MIAALADVFDQPQPAGVLAVLDAADAARNKLEDVQFVASFAPPITAFGTCVCGSTWERRSTDQIDMTADEKAAAAEAVADMLGRPRDELADRIVARVVDVINGERACADYDLERDWDDAHAYCGDDL